MNNDEKLYYHYCKVDTLYSMVTHKKLWLSDAKYMNDKLEPIYVNTVVNDILKNLEEDTSVDKNRIAQFEKYYNELKGKQHFLMCFSKIGDLLSQWRGYGDDAKGVSIGFDFNNTFYPKEPFSVNGKSQTGQLGYQDVNYKYYCTLKKWIIEAIKEKHDIKTSTVLFKDFDTIIKHSYFKEEQEVRLVYTPENQKQKGADAATTYISDKTLFRTRDNQIIPYYEFDFSTKLDLIKKIIIGSKSPLDTEELKFFLSESGFEYVKVVKSESPYQ